MAQWETHTSGQTLNPAFRDLQDQLMGVRLREVETAVELKEMRQRVMELETQNHVCTNQIRRQDDEYKKLQGELDLALCRERDVISQLNDIQHKLQLPESRTKRRRKRDGQVATTLEKSNESTTGRRSDQ